MSQIYPPTPPMAEQPATSRPPSQPAATAPAPSAPKVPKVSVWRRLAPVAVALVALTGGILAGVVVFRPGHSQKVAATPTTTVAPGNPDGRGRAGGPFGGRGFDDRQRALRGTITLISGRTLTVATFSGEAVHVQVTDATDIVKLTASPSGGFELRRLGLGDLATGDEVTVLGARQGGTVTATSVRVGNFRDFGDFGGPLGDRGAPGPP